MNMSETVTTRHALQHFGFTPYNKVISDEKPGLVYRFDDLSLTASWILNMRMVEIVNISGVLAYSNSLSEINIEMPREFDSLELCAAWIVWHLDQAASKHAFKLFHKAPWVNLGRLNLHKLPWNEQRERYKNRPCCEIERDWLKQAIRSLRDKIENANQGIDVIFGFDGEILTIRLGADLIAIPAKGNSWGECYVLKVNLLENLPKRIMRDPTYVSFWDGKLSIADWGYPVQSVVSIHSESK